MVKIGAIIVIAGIFISIGVAFLFYGEEYGQVGGMGPDSKRDMKFQNKLSFFESHLKKSINKIFFGKIFCHPDFLKPPAHPDPRAVCGTRDPSVVPKKYLACLEPKRENSGGQ